MTWRADLPTALRDRGIRVVLTDGWELRGYASLAPEGQVNHHTAVSGPCTPGSAAAMIRGRPDLAGPLCNTHGGLDADGRPVLFLVAGRRARHAGPGSPVVLDELLRDVAPSGDAKVRDLDDSANAHGNRRLLGHEWQHPGDASPWPDELIELIAATNAAVAELFGWGASRSIAHREWTRRKIDPSSREDLRALIAAHLEDGMALSPEVQEQFDHVNTQLNDLRARLGGLTGEIRRVGTAVASLQLQELADEELAGIAEAIAKEQEGRKR